MALTTRQWTRADLERLPDDGNKYELIHGELLVSPAPRPAHEFVKRALRRLLEAYCDRESIGHVFEGHAALVTPDSEVMPDLLVREPQAPPPLRWDDAPVPLLVVEVSSESTRRYDLVRKRAFYLETGVAEYWMVDGDSRSVCVISAGMDRVETKELRWQPPQASEPLSIDLTRLFDEALGPH